MVTFVKMIRILKKRFTVILDQTTTISDIILDHSNSGIKYILIVVDSIGQVYNIDISKLMINEKIPNTVINISELIYEFITPEMMYSYHSPEFSMNNIVKFLQESDVTGNVSVTAYSIIRKEPSPVYDDPHYPDLELSSGIDLTRMIPVIDGLLKKCIWTNEKVYIRNSSKLVYTKDVDGFLSFQNASNIKLIKLSLILDNNGIIQNQQDEYNYIPVLVLGGILIYDNDSIYKFINEYQRLSINQNFIMQMDAFSDFNSFEDLVSSVDSFVILVACNNIIKREVSLVDRKISLSDDFVETNIDKFINFYCTHELTNKLERFICLKEKFVKTIPGLNSDGLPHHNEIHVENVLRNENLYKLNQLVLI